MHLMFREFKQLLSWLLLRYFRVISLTEEPSTWFNELFASSGFASVPPAAACFYHPPVWPPSFLCLSYKLSLKRERKVSPCVLGYPGVLEGELGQAAGVVGPGRGFGGHPGFGPFPPVEGLLDANPEVGAVLGARFDGGRPGRQASRGAARALQHVLELVDLDALVLQLLAQLGQSSGLLGELLLQTPDLLLSGTELLILPLALSLQLLHPGPQGVQGRDGVPAAVVLVGSAVGGVRVFVTL